MTTRVDRKDQLVKCPVGHDPDMFTALHHALFKTTFKESVVLFVCISKCGAVIVGNTRECAHAKSFSPTSPTNMLCRPV